MCIGVCLLRLCKRCFPCTLSEGKVVQAEEGAVAPGQAHVLAGVKL